MKNLSPNHADLFRVLCMPRCSASEREFAQVIGAVGDWDAVLERARQHRVLPLLHLKLKQCITGVPDEVLAKTRAEYERNSLHCMTNAEELLRVLSDFEAAGIHAMPFKGVVLASVAYHDVTARTAGDLDVLIRYQDLQTATAILRSRGYELKTKTLEDGSPEAANYFEFHFERASDGMVLELRWRLELTQPGYRYNLGLDWVWAERRNVLLFGAPVPNLDPERSLLMLCMHGSKHAWSRWIWICDVAKLIQSEPDLDWALTRMEAKRVGLERCLALGVLLAVRGAGAVVPARISKRFAADRAMRRLADCLLNSLLEYPQIVSGLRLPYHLQILGSRDRARALLSPSILQPNERDRSVVRLPRLLAPLYYLIRPVRILIERSAR